MAGHQPMSVSGARIWVHNTLYAYHTFAYLELV